MAEHQREWEIFVENREAVLAALERGECAGILPAVRGFLDGFAGFLLEAGVLDSRGTAASRYGKAVLSGTLGQCASGASTGGTTAPQTGFRLGQGEDDLTIVVLASLSAKVEGQVIRVRWETASEVDLLGFHLHRAETPTGTRTQLTDELIPGKARDPLQSAKYDWLDDTVILTQVYVYWLKAVHADGSSTFYEPVVALPPCEWRIFLPVVRRQHLESV
jgi:hypothetical protein